MASSSARTVVNDRGQRTNSLGYAKHDCHTCSALKRACDRQRPRCGPCLLSRQRCGGFATKLVWKNVEVPSPAKVLGPESGTWSADSNSRHSQKEPAGRNGGFKFVKGRMKRKRKPKAPPSELESLPGANYTTDSRLNSQSMLQLSPWFANSENVVDIPDPMEEACLEISSHCDELASELTLLDETPVFHGTTSDSSWVDSPRSSSAASPSLAVVSPIPMPDEMFNSAVTGDGEFFVGSYSAKAISPLDPGVSALSMEDDDDRDTVEGQYHLPLEIRYHDSAQKYEPILAILLSLPLVPGVFIWTVLEDSSRLPERWKFVKEALAYERKLHSWWDVTLAFLSREDLRLPLTYLEMLLECGDSPECSFFALNGCSLELVMAMARLAKLAAIYEKTRQMEWTIFDRTPVDQVIAEVKSFVNKEDATLDDTSLSEDDPDAKRDCFHCIEAWRHAILLYTCRVFTPWQDSAGIRMISYLARVTLDHVRCISRRSFIQKQVLLPVFLAGSEVGDEQDRAWIREYCKHWSAAARFYMFESTRFLLEDIWQDWDVSTRDSYWWGLKVGSSNIQRTNGEVAGLATQVLLG
ncbi:hypothetical protein H2200_008643 [Cladophialophora chaetospira]|uniref:Zn(2)-C6 fungal-type domain-containing protein n=1 Tax=Cladophialophora chaetospira TaxID=386627 RepID=A0AA38X4T0_9EURO|nr:hypothetical protein H2200_008643 [Cladophialophora chaetospira]